jgi:hypothetical protein
MIIDLHNRRFPAPMPVLIIKPIMGRMYGVKGRHQGATVERKRLSMSLAMRSTETAIWMVDSAIYTAENPVTMRHMIWRMGMDMTAPNRAYLRTKPGASHRSQLAL